MPHRALVTVLMSLALLVAQDPGLEEGAAFLDGLGRVRELMSEDKWTEATSALQALLAAHERKPYVGAHRDAVVEIARTCWVSAQVAKPHVKEVLRCQVLGYEERSGYIKLRYTEFDDWERGEVTIVHPLVFVGSYSVTIKGKSYPSHPRTVAISVDVDETGHNWLAVDFGLKGDKEVGTRHIDARILWGRPGRSAGAKPEELALVASPAAPHKTFTATVRVKDDRVEVLFNNKTLIRHERQGATGGRVALSLTPYQEVLLDGYVDPAWLKKRVFEEWSARRAEMAPKFDAGKELPTWLLEVPPERKQVRCP